MQTFNPNNNLTINDVIEGLQNHKEYKFTYIYFLEEYSEIIGSFSQLAKFIKEFDFTDIRIESYESER